MGCNVSKAKTATHEHQKPPETWIEYGLQMDSEFAGIWNEKFKNTLQEHGRSDQSIDEKVHLLIIETDIRVIAYTRWASNNIRFANIHNASKDNEIIERCRKPDLKTGIPGDVIWRGIKDDDKTSPVITRAIELGWEPVKTRLNRILAPSVVSDYGAITWNTVQLSSGV